MSFVRGAGIEIRTQSSYKVLFVRIVGIRGRMRVDMACNSRAIFDLEQSENKIKAAVLQPCRLVHINTSIQ